MSHKFSLIGSLSALNPRSLKYLSEQIQVLIEKKLWAKILAGMLLGIVFGFLISDAGPMHDLLAPYRSGIDILSSWLAFPAKLFLKLIQMVIVPLILASIIRGLASPTDVHQMKSLGIKFGLFVLVNTLLACLVGVMVATILKPGVGLGLQGAVMGTTHAGSLFNLSPESLLSIIPMNPLASIVEGQMLDVVILSMIAGIAILSIPKDQAKHVIDGLEVVQQVCMTIISWGMRLAPYAVFGMMAQVTATTGFRALGKMVYYVFTSYLGFTLMGVFYLILVSVFAKANPLSYLKKIISPMLLAFSTSSSAATMPVTMKVAEEELHVNPNAARFLLPLGTTINMAGTAIWQTSAVIFIAQAYGLDLTLPQLSVVIATSVGSAIGTPAVSRCWYWDFVCAFS